MQISREAMKQILAAVKDGSVAMLEASGAPPKGLNIQPGTVVTGELLAKLPNGRSLVRVSGEILDMPLPKDAQIGSSLKMTFVGNQPRPTFAVPSQTMKTPDVSISNASRWLGTLTSATFEPAEADRTLHVKTAPLFDSLPANSGAIAARLKEAVSRSGVFYESHLERWANGNYPLKEILREPQGQRSPVAGQQSDAQPGPAGSSRHSLSPDADPAVSGRINAAVASEAGVNTQPVVKSTPYGTTLETSLPTAETAPDSGRSSIGATKTGTDDAETDAAMGKERLASDTGLRQEPAKTSSPVQPARIVNTGSAAQANESPGFTSTAGSGAIQPPLKGRGEESGSAQPDVVAEAPSKTTPALQTLTGQTETVSIPAGKPSDTDNPVIAAKPDGKGSSATSTDVDQPDNHPVDGKGAMAGSAEENAVRTPVRGFMPNPPADSKIPLPSLTSALLSSSTIPAGTSSSAETGPSASTGRDQPAGTTETQMQSPRMPESVDLQTRVNRQLTDMHPGKALPLVAPEIVPSDPLPNQSREPAGMAARPGAVPFEPPDSQTVPFVRQQLEMLNTGQFVWQGEVWHGQKMAWNISRDEKRKQSSQARSWDTDLNLELPNLGTVTASVRITGNQASISITASEANTATSMEKQSSRLIQGLENGGLTLASLEVKHVQTS